VIDQHSEDKESLEAKARSLDWKVQAEAVARVNKRRLWLDWRKSDGTHYISFLDWCQELGWSGASGYRRVRLGMHEHFSRIRNLNLTMNFVERLYKLDDELFELAIAFIEYGYTEEQMAELLEDPDAVRKIRNIVEWKIQQLTRIKQIIISIEDSQKEEQ